MPRRSSRLTTLRDSARHYSPMHLPLIGLSRQNAFATVRVKNNAIARKYMIPTDSDLLYTKKTCGGMDCHTFTRIAQPDREHTMVWDVPVDAQNVPSFHIALD